MPFKAKKIHAIYLLYWVLLAYILAALIFWFIALSQQNAKMTTLRLEKLKETEAGYAGKVQAIAAEKRLKTAQYIGEGSTFFILIIAGAIFVFRAVRRQLKIGQEQQNFMMAITHELKTPIAVTKLNLETMQKRKLEPQQQERLIKNTLQEANRLNDLCNNLLFSSQLEGNYYKISLEDTDWSKIVEAAVRNYQIRYPELDLSLTVQGTNQVYGDASLLEIVVSNLLDNAIKYSAAEKRVYVKLFEENNFSTLEVKDSGMGIPVEDREKIFKKFYRVGNAATRAAKGTGLGLYLCDKIVKAHKGKISVVSDPGAGSTFSVTLKTVS